VANGRQHDAAGVDTGEHQRVDAVGAQQRLQVGANERADAVLDYDRFPLSCRCSRMDCGAFAAGHRHSVCLQRAEQGVTGADLGMAGPECDNDVVIGDVFSLGHRETIISAAARTKVPAIYFHAAFAREGGLFSYGPDNANLFRRAATYVDRILRGADPGGLPVQVPIKFARGQS
jgi:ABC transporter substrate binding protein